MQYYDPSLPIQAKRQRALADSLVKLGQQPTQNEMVGGFVVPQSPLAGLARALTQGVGGYIGGQADQADTQEQRNRSNLYAEALKDPKNAQQVLAQGDPDAQKAALSLAMEKMKNDAAAKNALIKSGVSGAYLDEDGELQYGNGNGIGAPNNGLTGQEFLSDLASKDPQSASQIKALAEGRMAFPTGFAAKSPYWQQKIAQVAQYDPNFDANNFNTRAKTRKDYSPGGKVGQNIASIETALNTTAQLKDASDKIGGVESWGPLNAPLNWVHNKYLEATNDPDLVSYNNLAKAAADETTKAVVGAGGTGADRQTREKLFRAGQSPQARQAALASGLQELNARLDPLANGYNQSMGTSSQGLDLLSPQAQQSYAHVLGRMPNNSHVGPVKNKPAAQGVKFLGFE